MSMKTATRIVSVAAAAACVLAVVSAPAQAKVKAKATVCTRSLKLDTKSFSAMLALGAKAGFSDNAAAHSKLTKSLRSAASRYNTKVKIRNGACTREVKRQAIARDATLRRAKTTLNRAVSRQKYAAAVAHAQAVREDAVYRAFLGWMDEVDSIYGQYDAATNSPATALARAEFRHGTSEVRAALRAKIISAFVQYQALRSAAGFQKSSALASVNGMSSAQARSVATLAAWDTYVRSVISAQRNALTDRSTSLPEATEALETAHAEFEHETETSGPVSNVPDPEGSTEATPAP